MGINKLASVVTISRQYQRSIRIESDLGRIESLDGYICHATSRMALENLSRQVAETKQRSFTITGPFGGGKSSLAICFASALLGDEEIRLRARTQLQIDNITNFDKAFPVERGWLVLAISGRRTSVVQEISRALNVAMGSQVVNEESIDPAALIKVLLNQSASRSHDGLLLVIDEMGKFLEYSALGGDDIHFFQELAEHSNRADSKFIVLGILHQAFRQYASKLGSDTRDDWAKVQGRYSDISLTTSSDEVVSLIGNAISTTVDHPWTKSAANTVGLSIQHKRPSYGDEFPQKLDDCWPLHPAMAALLGPISKRQFGQNERSTFGFLTSAEPHAFRTFLENTDVEGKNWYTPADYWDFIKANLEAVILSSSDSHRWTQAVVSVEAIEAQGEPLKISLMKNIAILDLFRGTSALLASTEVLCSFYCDIDTSIIETALAEISTSRAAVYRKYLDSWVVYDGSDFDIEAALLKAKGDFGKLDNKLLEQVAGLYPVVAKRHLYHYGTMRWMDVRLTGLDELESVRDQVGESGGFGQFILVIPESRTDLSSLKTNLSKFSQSLKSNSVLGIAPNYLKLRDLATDMVSFKLIDETNHILPTDAVARREVAGRKSDTRSALESEIQIGIETALWFVNEQWRECDSLSHLTSDIADKVFKHAPIIRSELINRDSLSSNAVKARRSLLHNLVLNESKEDLGLQGWPAERGLYQTLLVQFGLHGRGSDGEMKTLAPMDADNSFYPLWEATDRLFVRDNQLIAVSEIYDFWKHPPFGLRNGILPVIIVIYLLTRRDAFAIYRDSIFQTEFDDATIDELLQDPSAFSLRKVIIDEHKNAILKGIASILSEVGHQSSFSDPLETARGLVSFFDNLPEWTRRTKTLSSTTSDIRDALIKAKDPHKLLFVDLPTILKTNEPNQFLDGIKAPLHELAHAYPKMLRTVEAKFLSMIDADARNVLDIRERAALVHGLSGDMNFDSLAVNLQSYDHSLNSVEVILGTSIHLSPNSWSDMHVDEALFQLNNWATRFRQAEALASVKNRKPSREAFAVVIGSGAESKTLVRVFDVAERDKEKVTKLSQTIMESIRGLEFSNEVALAALAEAGIVFANKINE